MREGDKAETTRAFWYARVDLQEEVNLERIDDKRDVLKRSVQLCVGGTSHECDGAWATSK